MNLLLFIWGSLPFNDFGVALVIFTILTRLLMWPLVQKQIRQSKALRAIQPELKEIREKYKAKEDRQLMAQAQMELYKSKNVSPFGSILILFIQLPLFLGVFSVVRQLAETPEVVAERVYGAVGNIDRVQGVVQNPESFEKTFFGIDLAQSGFSGGFSEPTLFIPLIIIALYAAFMQFKTAKMLAPTDTKSRSLKEILKAEAEGNQAEQSEIMAASAGMLRYMLPVIIFFFALTTTGSIALYLASSATFAFFQQTIIARSKATDVAESDITVKTYNADEKKKAAKKATKSGKKKPIEAEIVKKAPKKKSKKTASKKKSTKKKRI